MNVGNCIRAMAVFGFTGSGIDRAIIWMHTLVDGTPNASYDALSAVVSVIITWIILTPLMPFGESDAAR